MPFCGDASTRLGKRRPTILFGIHQKNCSRKPSISDWIFVGHRVIISLSSTPPRRKVPAMPSPPSDELLVEFQGRMSFLETMWGCKTAYDVDIETGRGWLEVRMPGTGAVLRINKFNVKDVMVPGEGGVQPSAT
jgi:hypothetical protein